MVIRYKIKSQKGFSLAETMLAILILTLVTVILANGIPVAKTIYENVTIGANARILLSTTISELRNALGNAKDIEVDKDGLGVSYFSTGIGARSIIFHNNANSPIMLREYYDVDNIVKYEEGVARSRNLVSESASNKNLYVTYKQVLCLSDNMIEFKELQVMRKGTNGRVDTAFGDPVTLDIRAVIGPVSETTVSLTLPTY